jgi:enamine deaminase RidA (YjgF/YER057c/UK114 family)
LAADRRVSVHRETFEIIEDQQAHFGYAQAVRVGDMIWIANTPGCDESLTFPDDMAGQLRQVYVNLTATLDHFSCSFADLVDVTVFVSNIDEYTAASAIHGADFFSARGLPASTLVEVSGFLLPQMLVSIKGTAIVGSGDQS